MYICVSRLGMQFHAAGCVPSMCRRCTYIRTYVRTCTYVHKHAAKIVMDVVSVSSEFSTGDVEESAEDRRQRLAAQGKQGKGLKVLRVTTGLPNIGSVWQTEE